MKPKKKKPRSELTKRRISETLTGGKLGGQDSFIKPEDSKELRSRVSQGDRFKYQALVDWWRDLKS
jgi:hypothetical protein